MKSELYFPKDETKVSVAPLMRREVEYTPDMSTTVGRLKHLRHVVERIPPAAFYIGALLQTNECGTVGCMLGWAGLDPHFKALGLGSRARGRMGQVTFNGRPDLFTEVASQIFGVTAAHAIELFGGAQPAFDGVCLNKDFTIAHGLARIDRMIEKYSA